MRPSRKEGFLTLPRLSSICAGAAPRNRPASEEPDVETPQAQACTAPRAVSGPTTTSCLWLQLKAPGVRRIKRSHTPPCPQTPPDRDDLGSTGKAEARGRPWGPHSSFLVAQGPGLPRVPTRAGWADRGSCSWAPGQGRLFKTPSSSQLKQTSSPWKHSLTRQSL